MNDTPFIAQYVMRSIVGFMLMVVAYIFIYLYSKESSKIHRSDEATAFKAYLKSRSAIKSHLIIGGLYFLLMSDVAIRHIFATKNESGRPSVHPMQHDTNTARTDK